MVAIFINTDAHVLNICYFLTSDVVCCHLNPREAFVDEGTLAVTCVGARVGRGQRVTCLKKLQPSVRTCLSVWGEGRDTEATVPRRISAAVWEILFPYSHLGRLRSQRLRGHPLSTRGMPSTQGAPAPLKCAPSLLRFLFLQLTVSKPLPGIVQALPE